MPLLRQRFIKHAPVLVAAVVVAATTTATSAYSANSNVAVTAVDSTPRPVTWKRDTLDGFSGKLWMKLVSSSRGEAARGALSRIFGDSAATNPGVYMAHDETENSDFAFVNLVPFAAKKKGMLGDYRMGLWPGEQRSVSDRYSNPEGFIQVTRENQDTRISEHFRLRDFLTKDQATTWPKYLVLQERLIDKLELVIGALNTGGNPVKRMSVMSGFRTPQYNQLGVGAGGRAQDSRHQYGDAADVFVDNDGSGRMDDLNGDGRVNTGDARYLAQVVDQVEKAHPELIGGVGVYAATGAHGPFVHIDVRGSKARW